MKTKICLIITLAVLAPGQLRAVDIDFYSDATIENGDLYDNVFVYDTTPDQTTVDMLGGSIDAFHTYDSSIVNIYGGEILWGILSLNSSTVNLHGGTINCESLTVSNSSTLNIYGGDLLVGNSPGFSDSSTVNIYGYDFNRGTNDLTGFLSDGSPFAFTELPDSKYSHMNLIVIPEPATLFLLALGSLLLRNSVKS